MNDDANKKDQIKGNKIILYDNSDPTAKIIREVFIITPNETKRYEMMKSKNSRYMLHK